MHGPGELIHDIKMVWPSLGTYDYKPVMRGLIDDHRWRRGPNGDLSSGSSIVTRTCEFEGHEFELRVHLRDPFVKRITAAFEDADRDLVGRLFVALHRRLVGEFPILEGTSMSKARSGRSWYSGALSITTGVGRAGEAFRAAAKLEFVGMEAFFVS